MSGNTEILVREALEGVCDAGGDPELGSGRKSNEFITLLMNQAKD